MVESVTVAADGRAAVTILLTISGCPLKETLTRDTTAALMTVDGVTAVDVTLGVMSDEQRTDLAREAARRGRRARDPVRQGRARSPASTPSRPARAAWASRRSPSTWRPSLAQGGLRVGVVDADVYGFSVPRMLGVERPPDPGRRHDPAAARARREGHLDRHVRPRQPAGRLARADAAPRAAAVPRRRLLGRPRRAPARPAAGHRRHRDLGGPADPRRRDPRRHHPAAGGRRGGRAGRGRSRCRPTSASSASIENMSWLELPDGSRQEIFGSGGGQSVADSLTRAVGAPSAAAGPDPARHPAARGRRPAACRSCWASPTARPRWRCAASPGACRPRSRAWPAARWGSPPPVAEHRATAEGPGTSSPARSRVPRRGHPARGQVASVSNGVGRDGSCLVVADCPLTSPGSLVSSSSSASRTIRRGSY